MPSEPTGGDPNANSTSSYPDDFSALASTVSDHGDELRALPNVTRIGVGYKVIGGVETHRRCVTVFVTRKLPALELGDDELIPARFHLHPTDVVESAVDDAER